MSESLSDDEVADFLHRIVFDLDGMTGKTTAGDTALKTSRAALLVILAGLISLNERGREPRR